MNSPGSGGAMAQLDEYVAQIRQKLPAANPGLMDAYVRWAPWLAIIFGGLGLLFGVVAFILAMVGASLMVVFGGAEGVRAGAETFIALAFLAGGSALDVVGGYLMLRREATGWWLLAVGLLIWILSSVVRFSIVGLVISLAVAYVHIQVRPRYI